MDFNSALKELQDKFGATHFIVIGMKNKLDDINRWEWKYFTNIKGTKNDHLKVLTALINNEKQAEKGQA